jgi:hypothetical protein
MVVQVVVVHIIQQEVLVELLDLMDITEEQHLYHHRQPVPAAVVVLADLVDREHQQLAVLVELVYKFLQHLEIQYLLQVIPQIQQLHKEVVD